MTKVPLVGLGHRKQVGKDTAAYGLLTAGWHRLAFADVLKEMATLIDPVVGVARQAEPLRLGDALVEFGGWNGAKHLYEVRRFLQDLGYAGRRVIDEWVWVEPVIREAHKLIYDEKVPGVVITDVRFPNEVEAIQRSGGVVVKIERPDAPRDNSHVSETALDGFDGWDFVIVNDSTIGVLQATLKGLVTVA